MAAFYATYLLVAIGYGVLWAVVPGVSLLYLSADFGPSRRRVRSLLHPAFRKGGSKEAHLCELGSL
jgi:hypothetical protein